MDVILEYLETFLHYSVDFGAVILEIIGAYMMLVAAAKAFISWTKHKGFKDCLQKGIPRALEFLMCSEVLKTTTASSNSDYINLAVIIAIRFALAFEIHWESKHEHPALPKADHE